VSGHLEEYKRPRRCLECIANPPKPGGVCPECRNTKEVHDEIPAADLFTPAIVDFTRAFRAYHTHGVLPESGGLNDQAATFVDAVHFVETLMDQYHEDDRPKPKGRKHGR